MRNTLSQKSHEASCENRGKQEKEKNTIKKKKKLNRKKCIKKTKLAMPDSNLHD